MASELTAAVESAIAAIDPAEWDACAGADNPFVSHAFLLALEESRSVGRGTGWAPRHLTLREGKRLVGAVPLYVKGHSYGEYVFDHGWARAFEDAGGRYYPKLQAAVPFTPVPGPRLLVHPDAPATTADALVAGLETAGRQLGVSSVHLTFPTEGEWERLVEAGWLGRLGLQYHWLNEDYGSFDDFLAALASRKRKDIRKERQRARDGGITLRVLTGADLRPQHWDAFFAFYMNTSDRKWGSPYLTRAFFDRIGATMADRIALVMAERDGVPVAGALNLIGRDTLYGRNWGCDGDEHRFLHFEACYYAAIDFAIEHKLARVEAGAQGEHKIQRGYRPVRTYSAHWIVHEGLRAAVAHFLDRERPAVDAEIAALADALPFRHVDGEN